MEEASSAYRQALAASGDRSWAAREGMHRTVQAPSETSRTPTPDEPVRSEITIVGGPEGTRLERLAQGGRVDPGLLVELRGKLKRRTFRTDEEVQLEASVVNDSQEAIELYARPRIIWSCRPEGDEEGGRTIGGESHIPDAVAHHSAFRLQPGEQHLFPLPTGPVLSAGTWKIDCSLEIPASREAQGLTEWIRLPPTRIEVVQEP